MGESSYQFTEGSGRRQHTWQRNVGGTAVEDLFVAQSLAAYPTYSITVAQATMATANMHILEVMAGASNRVGIRRIVVKQRADAGAASLGFFELYRLTSAGTGGTAASVVALDPADPTAGASARHTVASSMGTEAGGRMRADAVTVTNALATVNPQRTILDWRFGDDGLSKMPWIAAGTANGIALKSASAVGTAELVVYCELVEVEYA